MSNIESVNISIGSNMYSRFEDLTNTPANVLAEFVDNALQSYRDNKERLHALDADYHFTVSIEFVRDNNGKEIEEIRITDNAAGISLHRYQTAFMPAKTPENNTGLNEFGMGFKTAACWLGEEWTVTTKALGEEEERTISFDMNQVTANDLRELPVETTPCSPGEHYTKFRIRGLSKNAPYGRGIKKIQNELANVYRQSLRRGEMHLIVDGEAMEFRDPEILTAPYFKSPDGAPVYWKKEIDFEFGPYKAKGYIGILKEMRSSDNGFVLLRRGRVVKGGEDGQRYYPKCLCGTVGSPRYKRIFGELELEGFKVSFNKNDILDRENLDALMEALKGEIHTKDFDLYAQAEGYRVDERKRQVGKLVRKHENANKLKRAPIEIETDKPSFVVKESELPTYGNQANQPVVSGSYKDDYKIDGVSYTLQVEFVQGGSSDLFWADVSKKKENIIICKINVEHLFFKHFGSPKEDTIAVLKTMAIAKYTASKNAGDDAVKMLEYFNEYIKHTKV